MAPEYEEIEKTCDGLDNDCDGETDEGLSAPEIDCLDAGVCSGSHVECKGKAGWLCGYPASYEEDEKSCDGLDNDCDGDTDEGFKIGEECEVGYGECGASGVRICSQDGKNVVCHVPEIKKPSPELCDGLDNDCDGVADNGFPIGEQCVSGTGICKVTGKYVCSGNGATVECSTKALDPSSELCGDLLDNDCDGFTDEEDCGIEGEGGEGGCRASGGSRHLSPFIVITFLTIAAIYNKKASFKRPGSSVGRAKD
ncbi:MAG: hypothetical protein FJ088_13685 [Deltaproteobacteria bacterium]|nr:hypothetical protein [Deltaproteobacteria bacterium]